ncbi:MAG: beta-ketoacyl synthase chain length factor [Verrucomicrobiaceae bacterium]|nr:beta-ketoacyl synthase chain length factor [Verrucomicrobiaceae bacterium]
MSVEVDVFIKGWGAVSPAGWSAGTLADVVLEKNALPVTEERRVDAAPLRRFRAVPPMSAQPAWLRHARLRRVSPATRFAVSAALEALGGMVDAGSEPTGVIFTTMNGSVTFSRRFFAEVCENPALASPILFPETVFNAPASHLGAVLGTPAANYTLIGDSAQFLRGLDVAVHWLAEGRVSQCLVVAAEELDWLSTEALHLFPGDRVAAEGAAAVWLSCGASDGIRIDQITGSILMGHRTSRAAAAAKMRAQIDTPPAAVVCDSRCGSSILDADEEHLWPASSVHSPARWLGEGFGVSAGWQTVLACELLHRGAADSAVISAIGHGQQAIGAVLAQS